MKIQSGKEKRGLMAQVDQLRQEKELPIKASCKQLGISDSSYYIWKKQLSFFSDKEDIGTAKSEFPRVTGSSKIRPEDQIFQEGGGFILKFEPPEQ